MITKKKKKQFSTLKKKKIRSLIAYYNTETKALPYGELQCHTLHRSCTHIQGRLMWRAALHNGRTPYSSCWNQWGNPGKGLNDSQGLTKRQCNKGTYQFDVSDISAV